MGLIVQLLTILLLLNLAASRTAKKEFVDHKGAGPYDRLFDSLYSRHYYSWLPPQKTVEVHIGVHLLNGQLNVYQPGSMLHNLWLYLSWNDSRLAWNPEEFGGIETISLPAKEFIWLPDIVPYNGVGQNPYTISDVNAVIHSDGSVYWMPPVVVTTPVSFGEGEASDTFSTSIKLGSWTMNGNEIILKDQGVDVMPEYIYKSKEFEIFSSAAKVNTMYYECCPEPYTDYTIQMIMKFKQYEEPIPQ